jgi:hypothetical protein
MLSFTKYITSNAKVEPEESKVCQLCIEPGAAKRKCCNATYCDHCYTKAEQCPNCKAGTRQEKLTGATYQVKVFSEHEECRICLEPGLQRRCCSNYYCDTCYYNTTHCRSCGTPVGHQNKPPFFNFNKAQLLTHLIGWSITIFTAMGLVAFFSVVLTAELQTPVGLSDFKCYGFFRECNHAGTGA